MSVEQYKYKLLDSVSIAYKKTLKIIEKFFFTESKNVCW